MVTRDSGRVFQPVANFAAFRGCDQYPGSKHETHLEFHG
jgi:hypothetical protein